MKRKTLIEIDRKLDEILAHLKFQRFPTKESVRASTLEKVVQRLRDEEDFDCGGTSCYKCEVPQRNECWQRVKKIERKRKLMERFPYARVELEEMSRSDLSIISSFLGINPFGLSRDLLVEAILTKEKERKRK